MGASGSVAIAKTIGIRRTRERITIPAYFFNANKATRAFPRGHRLAIAIDCQHPAGIFVDHVLADGCTPEVHGDDPGAIHCHVEPKKNGALVRLTTSFPDPVVIEEVVLKLAAGKAKL